MWAAAALAVGCLAVLLIGTGNGRAAQRHKTRDAAATATQVDGRWVAVTALPALARERINAAAGAALETLARVPDLLALGGT